jgi:large subunit ribosomal protein L18
MKKNKEQKRLRRRKHIRKTVIGTADKPRVYVFKSNKYLQTAFTDDRSG